MGKLFLPVEKTKYQVLKTTVAVNFNKFKTDTLTLRPSKEGEKFPRYAVSDDLNTNNTLTDSTSISLLVGGPLLWGAAGSEERALIYQWVEFADKEVNPAVCLWCFPFIGLRNFNKQENQMGEKQLTSCLQLLDQYFLHETFFVGERITQADIAVAAALYLAYTTVLDPSWQGRFFNVTRWFKTIINQPEFRKELNLAEDSSSLEVPLCTETPKFNQKTFEEMKKKWENPAPAAPAAKKEAAKGNAAEGSGKPKTAAQLKKEAKKAEKMAKFAAKTQKMAAQKESQKNKKKPEKKEEKKKNVVIRYEKNTPAGEKKDISGPLPDSYSPPYVEAAWYAWWEKSGFFKPEYGVEDVSKNAEGKFVMCLPPPNVTGSLHLGHTLMGTVQDVLVRWHKMQGKTVLWNPGTDHAGIATQVVVEKKLWREKQLRRHDLGREKFVEEVWKWKNEKGNRICLQLRKLGASLDWSREFFTMNEQLGSAVKEAFIQLHDKGTIFRSNRLVNWSCALKSAISDIEVDKKELTGRTLLPVPGYQEKVEFGVLISFAYKVVGSDEQLVVATTRIETMLGDTAVAVHPEDPRYKHLHGKMVEHPFCDRQIPIIQDEMVERDFGTGAVKITPAHDPNDYDCGKRHNLRFITMFTEEGLVANTSTKFDGMKRFDARKAVLDALKEKGLYIETKENPMVVPMCSRTKDIVEPLVKVQWFMDCKDVAKRSVDALRNGALEIIPEMFHKTWYHWLENIRDWCISRQLWWGHRIPAYFVTIDDPKVPKGDASDGNYWVSGRDEQEAREKASKLFGVATSKISLKQDEDVLDTWFSSGLLPFSMCGWPQNTDDLKNFFPGDLLETGHDILFFWVARMVFFSLLLTDKLPFKTVYLHALVRDAHGRKMSKSLGNVIDPLDVVSGISLEDLHKTLLSGNLEPKEVEKAKLGQKQDYPSGIPECGCDALRFALFAYTSPGRDINLDVLRVLGYRHFCNKLWNAFKFALHNLGAEYKPLKHNNKEEAVAEYKLTGDESLVDLWILSKLSSACEQSQQGLTTYQFPQYTTAVFNFWLYEFCDIYLECLKPVFNSDDQRAIMTSRNVLYTCLDVGLRLTQPLMPFICEELWQRLERREGDTTPSVTVTKWPVIKKNHWAGTSEVEAEMEVAMNIVKTTRSLRADYNLTKAKADLYIRCSDPATKQIAQKFSQYIQKLSYSSNVQVLSSDEKSPPGCALAIVNDKCDVNLMLKGIIDLEKEVGKFKVNIARQEKKLTQLKETQGKAEYQSKVPEAVKKADSEKIKQMEAELVKMKQAQSEFLKLLQP